MRKINNSIAELKSALNDMQGCNIKIVVSKGRGKTHEYTGQILALYESIVQLNIIGEQNMNSLSVSYNDLICGNVCLAISK